MKVADLHPKEPKAKSAPQGGRKTMTMTIMMMMMMTIMTMMILMCFFIPNNLKQGWYQGGAIEYDDDIDDNDDNDGNDFYLHFLQDYSI